MLAHQENPDVILITESHTHSRISYEELSLKGFNNCRNDREEGKDGGCII